MKFSTAAALAAFTLVNLTAGSAWAQDAAAPATGGKLQFELNKAQTVEAVAETTTTPAQPVSCQLTFVITNDTGTQIEKSSYNLAIINADGQVETLVTFAFKPLPVGRKKIQQFVLSGQSCEGISAISVNEFVQCEDPSGTALRVCEESIQESSRTAGIQFPW